MTMTANETAGVPRVLATAEDFIQVRAALVDYLGGAAEALVWTRIQFRTNVKSPDSYEHEGARWWRASRFDLATETGLRPEQVRRTIERLVKNGFVAGEQHRLEGNYDRAMSYRCRIDEAVTPNEQGVSDPSAGASVPNAPIEEVKKKSQEEEQPEGALVPLSSIAPNYADELAETFDECWQLWPKKVAKADAVKAFPRALRKLGAEKMIGEVQRYGWWASKYREPRTTLNFATWLNHERWNDELAVEVTRGPVNAFDRGDAIDERVLGLLNRPAASEQRAIEQ